MDTQKEQIKTSDVTRAFVDLAVGRDDIKALLEAIPDESDSENNQESNSKINKTTMEYELQLLKIVCTGWAISYYLVDHPQNSELTTAFWTTIQEFSERISEMSATAAGVNIMYFDLVKERADLYIKAMQMNMTEADPASVIGITFAEVCGSKDEPFTMTSGKRMFAVILKSVKQYLDAIEIVSDDTVQ